MIRTPPSFAARPEIADGTDHLLLDILQAVKLTGSVYLTASFTAPFNILAPSKFDPASTMGRLRHVSIFHLIASGQCDIEFSSGDRRRLVAGDIVLIPLGSEHRLSNGQSPGTEARDLFRPGPLKGVWTMDCGGGGEETRVVCGWLESSEVLFLPFFRTLPEFLVENMDGEGVSAVITTTVRSILDLANVAAPGTELVLGRLMETLFIEVLRRRAMEDRHGATGWIAAFRDPILSRAILAVHEAPARRWTVKSLAQKACTSRTVLAERFVTVLGKPPMDYVTSWRMQLAAVRIRNGRDSFATIAAGIGYESEAAFSRAFKRVTGVTPGRWRQENIPAPG